MSHFHKQPSSGSKWPISLYAESCGVIRALSSTKADVLIYLESIKNVGAKQPESITPILQASPNPIALARPIYSAKVSAGQSRFPSPAQDYEQKFLDLNERYISNPPATFFFEVKGNSMEGAGIFEGDTVIVDRAVKPKSSSIVIAAVDGEWMVKRLYKRGNLVKLLSEHPDHAPITFSEGQELVIFGVVTYVIHQPK